MSIIAIIYLSLLAFLILANVFYFVAARGKGGLKPLVMAYELLSGVFLVFMAAAYCLPWLREWTGLSSALAFAFVVGFDMRYSVWGSGEELGIPKGELSDAELELAKALSLAFAAPAYVMGLLLSLQIAAGA